MRPRRRRHRPALAAACPRLDRDRADREEAPPRRAGHLRRAVVVATSTRSWSPTRRSTSCCAATAPSRRCTSCSSHCATASPSTGSQTSPGRTRQGVRVNPHAYLPASLDYVDIRPDLVIEMMARYRDFDGPVAVQRLVAKPDRSGLHREGLRLRMRHLRQLAYHLHAPHEAAAPRVPQPGEPRRQRRGIRATDARARLR